MIKDAVEKMRGYTSSFLSPAADLRDVSVAPVSFFLRCLFSVLAFCLILSRRA